MRWNTHTLRCDDLLRVLLDLESRAWAEQSRRAGMVRSYRETFRRIGANVIRLARRLARLLAHVSSSPSSLPGRRALAPAYTRICLPPARSTSIGCFHFKIVVE